MRTPEQLALAAEEECDAAAVQLAAAQQAICATEYVARSCSFSASTVYAY
jgi:hypothetical protein